MLKLKEARNIVTVLVMVTLVFGMSLAFLITPSKAYTPSERRSLAQKPKITAEALASGRFMSDFEAYTLDQFPARDTFRSLKALTVNYLFFQKDNNGFYRANGQTAKVEYPMNTSRLNRNIAKLQEVWKTYMEETDCHVYLSIIPDKNFFLAEKSGHLSIDYEAMIQMVSDGLPMAEYVEITAQVEEEDFYTTDQHWRQEKIVDVAQTIFEAMGGTYDDTFSTETLDTPFYGTYVGQAALPVKPDEILYLTNLSLENCLVTSYNTGSPKEIAMYTLEKAKGNDAYEIFLSGADPLITIENPQGIEGKELVVFRDSFGSSLIPLMVQDYQKITVVDFRYFRSDLLGEFVEFTDQDVLFLYSTLILNSQISQ